MSHVCAAELGCWRVSAKHNFAVTANAVEGVLNMAYRQLLTVREGT